VAEAAGVGRLEGTDVVAGFADGDDGLDLDGGGRGGGGVGGEDALEFDLVARDFGRLEFAGEFGAGVVGADDEDGFVGGRRLDAALERFDWRRRGSRGLGFEGEGGESGE
jgi:hypothetical protein